MLFQKKSQDTRSWQPRSGRARVLIEDADGASQWAIEGVLAKAGYDVVGCDGPEHLPKGRCPLVTEGHCALAEGADVIVNSLPLNHEPNRKLLATIRGALPQTPVVLEVTPLRARHFENEVAGCRLVHGRVDQDRLLSEVAAAINQA